MAESVGSRHWPLARSSVLGESSMWYPGLGGEAGSPESSRVRVRPGKEEGTVSPGCGLGHWCSCGPGY